MSTTGYIVTGILVLIVFFVIVTVRKLNASSTEYAESESLKLQQIKEHGIPAMGKILSCEQLNISSTGVVRLLLTVEVTKEGEAPYQVTSPNPTLKKPPFSSFKFLVKDVHQIKVGAVLPIQVHPTEPYRIAFNLNLEEDGWVPPAGQAAGTTGE